jgi:flagellar basal-body rod protein FlgG
VQRGYHEAFYLDGRRPERFNRIVAPGGGIRTIETFSNYGNGVVNTTSNALDVALTGPGFFKVEGPDGVRYTRNGRFSIADGKLITLDGDTVLSDADTPIDVTGGEILFDGTGNVRVDGEDRAKLGIVEFDDPHVLTREGLTLFRAPQGVNGQAALNTSVMPQSIENSNVELPTEMINMMTALRAYAANQQVIQSVNETASRMINQVGGVG